MVLNDKTADIQSNIDDGEVFSLNSNDAGLFDILSTKLYSNPIQSVIREVLSNAIDANIAAGVENPVQIHFPNEIDPTFWVRDYGIGMDAAKMRNVFTYGGSDKRDTNDQIGGLGVGAKSPFSVADTWTVESSKDGIKRTALCYRGPDRKPRFKFIGEEPSNETGTKVYFAVPSDKHFNYVYEAIPVLAFAQQMPELLNGVDKFLQQADVESLEQFNNIRKLLKGENRLIVKTDKYSDDYDATNADMVAANKFIQKIANRFSGTIVDMGGVPYDVDIAQVFDGDYDAIQFFKEDSGYHTLVLHFPIGSLNFQASREKLNYTEATKNALKKSIVNFYSRKAYEELATA